MAVNQGRDIAPLINDLLCLPFTLRIATRDFHPPDHVSFAASHTPPHNKAFESTTKISSLLDAIKTKEIPLWPIHCVQGTKGAEIIPEIDVSKFDDVMEKGRDSRVEMFSGFADIFGSYSSIAASMNLADRLHNASITHVFTVGIAGDYCVKYTALDAKKSGFEVCVVEEATRCVDGSEKGWASAKRELDKAGIQIVHVDGPQVQRVKDLIS